MRFLGIPAVALFPEGTTEGGHVVLPFRPTLLASLFPALPSVQVQPVAIDYGDDAEEIAWIGAEPAGDLPAGVDVEHGVEVVPDTLDRPAQFRDVPGPDLIRRNSQQFRLLIMEPAGLPPPFLDLVMGS